MRRWLTYPLRELEHAVLFGCEGELTGRLRTGRLDSASLEEYPRDRGSHFDEHRLPHVLLLHLWRFLASDGRIPLPVLLKFVE